MQEHRWGLALGSGCVARARLCKSAGGSADPHRVSGPQLEAWTCHWAHVSLCWDCGSCYTATRDKSSFVGPLFGAPAVKSAAEQEWFDWTLVDIDVAINSFMWQNGGHSGPDHWEFVLHPVTCQKWKPMSGPQRPAAVSKRALHGIPHDDSG